MKIKKILLITFEFPPYLGGAGVYAHDTAIGLSKNNCQVDIVTYTHNDYSKEIQATFKAKYNINIFLFKPKAKLHFIQFIWLIKKILKNNKYDLVILNDNRAKSNVALCSSYLKLDLNKVICVFHGFELKAYFDNQSFFKKITGVNKKLLKILHRSPKIVTISKNERDQWNARFPEFKTKNTIVYHGVCEDIFYKREDTEINQLKKKYNIPKDKKILLSASRLEEIKCQDVVIKAFHDICKEKRDVLLIIAGDGSLKKYLIDLAQSLGIQDKVMFLGSINREQLAEFYNIADIFVLVSKYESFGLVYLEAAACGLPVISGNNGGVVDLVKNDVNGYAIDPTNQKELKEKIYTLLYDKELYDRLSQTAHQQYVQQYTCTHSAKRLLDSIYQ